ncbi:pLS20_p028 family conjugation system transmembrane protein [Metasolibacillus fluoroglycofenilyticus]|uniref:pLS20_p028 family conjugation system transmembrane protein n=1 Tax=Metasolibacillus fluoroglycofenilyticus TaxID=1239396 RepID=UPI000D3C786D|nr:hypothetical protein [Metasolibacillus fluoroglycofenilyticus]
MNDQEIIEKHKLLDSILHVNDGFMWQDVLRALGSGIVISLSWFNRMLETVVTKIITLNDFYSTGAVGEFMDKARPFIWVVFFIAILILGFQFMMNKVEKRNEVLLNIVLALCFIVIIPDLMSNMKEIIGAGIEQIKPEKESLASNMIKSNVADVLYYAENDFQFSNGRGDANTLPRPENKEDGSGTSDYTYANRFSASSALYIPFTQKLDFHEDDGWLFKADWVRGLSNSTKEVLKTKSVPTGVGNSYQVEELAKNKIRGTEIGRETYYRYHVNWFTLIISLLVTSFALAVTAIKIGRSIFDLAFHQIFGVFIAASDLTGGQRTKKVLVEIVNTFVVMVVMIALLQLFILFANWANSWRYEIGTWGVIILLIAGAWALIDAPDIVQRQLGIDAGLRNGWQAMMGAYAASKVASGGAKALGNAAKKTASATGGGMNFMRRMAEGMRTPTPNENHQRNGASIPNMPGSQSGKGLKQAESSNQENQAMMATPTEIPSSAEIASEGAMNVPRDTTYTPLPSQSPATSGETKQQGEIAQSQNTQQRKNTLSNEASLKDHARIQPNTNMQNSNTTPLKQVPNGEQQGIAKQNKTTAIPINEGTAPLNKTGIKEMPPQEISSQGMAHQGVTSIPASEVGILGNQNESSTSANQETAASLANAQQKVADISSNNTEGKAGAISKPLQDIGSKGQQGIPLSEGTKGVKPKNQADRKMPAAPPINQGTSSDMQQAPTVPINNETAPSTPISVEAGSGIPYQDQGQSGHQQHVAQRADQQSTAQKQVNKQSKSKQAPFGHRQAVHTNTIIGGNRHVQELKESVTRAGNSGFSLGQNIRRATKFVSPKKKNNDGGNK